MNKNLFGQLLIFYMTWLVSFSNAQLQSEYDEIESFKQTNPYCEQWNSKQVCVKCKSLFELSNDNICTSTCTQGTYYSQSSGACVAVCDPNYDSQQLYRTCEQILQCQKMQSFGNNYHDSSIQGVRDLSDKYFLSFDKLNFMLIWNKDTLELVSKLRRLHEFSIDDVLFFQSKFLLSWSQNEIILWDIDEGDVNSFFL